FRGRLAVALRRPRHHGGAAAARAGRPAVGVQRGGRMNEDEGMTTSAGPETIRGACGHDCPDTGHWMADVPHGLAARLHGHPPRTSPRAPLCAEANPYRVRVYQPDRVL